MKDCCGDRLVLRRPHKYNTATVTTAVLLVIAAAVIAGCGGTSASKTTTSAKLSSFYTGPSPGGHPVRGGTLNIAWSYTAEGFQPQVEGNAGDFWLEGLLYDSLVTYAPGSSKPQPDLAQSWTISSDRLTYTFHLRSGVKFSDGTPVTPQNTEAALKAISDPKSTLYVTTIGKYIKGISLVGSSDLRIQLSKPYGLLLYMLGSPSGSIISMKYYKKVGLSNFTRHPLGSGPFEVKSFVPNGAIHLVRNPYYWRTGQPYLNAVNITPTPDPSLRRLSVTTGRAQIADAIPYDQLASLSKSTATRLILEPLSNTALVQMNETYAPLKTTAVRKALSYATPRQAMLDTVFHGYAEVANAGFPPGPGFDTSIKQLPYDIAKAKATLARSPYPHGFKVQIDVTGGDATAVQIAEFLQSSWAQIGVKASIRQLDSGTFATNLLGDAAKYQIAVPPAVYWVTNTPLPSEGAQLFMNPGFYTNAFNTFYNNPTVVHTADKALAATVGTPEYTTLIRSLQQASVNDPSVLALAYVPSVVLASPHVCNFNSLFNGYWPLNLVYLSDKC